MIDHVGMQVADLSTAANFYDTVLATLGVSRIMDFGVAIGYGADGKPDFWISAQETGDGFRESHIAFAAADRAGVDAFFAAATGLGAEVLHDLGCGPNTTRATTAPSCATPTATTSRPSAIPARNGVIYKRATR